jgi:hypothetical protein
MLVFNTSVEARGPEKKQASLCSDIAAGGRDGIAEL